ncbi:YppG family protein [Neobacillus soli]|uniref:YppG family protein n=1 Tax=Neobacillus soli TaxID=220688 RepID=UPI000A047FE8|nr:YppG family protein [Neobacillus soli]
MLGEKRPSYNDNYGYSGQMMHQDPNGQLWNHQHLKRNQPYPYQTQPQNYDWYAYQQQNTYYPQQQSFAQPYQPGFVPQNVPFPNQPIVQKDSQFLFQNPLQPQDEMIHKQPYIPMNGYPMMNPYPKQSAMPKQPGGVQSFMNSFKSQDGSVDVNKMVNTAGQMMNAVTQVSSLVKGFGGFFKA